MLVGEQPGDQEDLAGHPFVGPAGKLLDRALAEAGVDRSAVYVTNVVKHFKVGAAGQASYSQETGRRRDCGVPAVARNGDSAREAARARMPGRDRCAGAARTPLQSVGAAWRVRRVALATMVLATVHPSSILRARDEASRHAELKRFIDDLRKVQRALARRSE